jgi:putative DNA primase/helicase
MVLLAQDPELKGLVAYNDFTHRTVLRRDPPPAHGIVRAKPLPRPVEDPDCVFVLGYLQRTYNHLFRLETVRHALLSAELSHFHPVLDYLDGLAWDGVPRIGTWLTDAFGAPVDPYHHSVGAKFLQAAVRRVRRPGCKFDFVLVLEGRQSIGKSRACRALFGDDWFSDNLPPDLTSHKTCDSLQGLWGIEFAEIVPLLTHKPEAMKAFLSRQIDRYMAPYGRATIDRPRQCVFIGTTNDDDYALGASGNRRLWPCRCEHVAVSWIEANRDQLWAEAAVSEPGTALWLDDDVVEAEALDHQAARHDDDPWEGRVIQFARLAGGYTTVPDILSSELCIPIKDHDKRAQMRVAAILKRAGWIRELSWTGGGKPERRWSRPEH